jgi:hypothetical protein
MTLKQRLVDALRRAVRWGVGVPVGVRSALGVVLMVAGVFGILPILGFWMLPVGAAFIALDVPPLRRRLLARLNIQSH